VKPRTRPPVPARLRVAPIGACLAALAFLVGPGSAQEESPTTVTSSSGYDPAALSGVRFLAEGEDGREYPLDSMTYTPDYGKDVLIRGRIQRDSDWQITLLEPNGGSRASIWPGYSGKFSFRFRPRVSGTYRLSTLGGRGPSATFNLRVRPIVIVNPALLVTQGSRNRVVPMRAGRRIVVSGWARPKASTRSGRVQLQYQSKGRWVDLSAPSGVGPGGEWRLTYRLTRAARVDAWLRVVYRATVSKMEARSLPFVVPIRLAEGLGGV